MGMIRTIVAAAAGLTFTGMSTWHTLDTLLPQPGQPSKQPAPKNPQPRPQNPIPDPNRPGAPNKQPDKSKDGEKEQVTKRDRSPRPFAFQSPDMEARFNKATRRLLQMEQRMQRSQEDLLKRLGEARQLTGERQTNALMDVVQQLLRDQADLHRYLVQSRTAWTGDVEGVEGEDVEEPELPAAKPEGSPNDR